MGSTLTRLRALAPEALAREQPHFRDGRLEELLFRYRARNFAATLDPDERERWQAHCAARLHEGAGGGPTLQAWMQQIDTLAEQAMERSLYRRDMLIERPLLQSLTQARSPVLLIDELDRADEPFDAFLLELLAENQMTIPELGTVRAEAPPPRVEAALMRRHRPPWRN